MVWLLSGCSTEPGRPPGHRGPIVLITFDSLRADVVEALRGEPGLTPNLDSLIAEATWAGRAVAPASWTAASMASLFTGLQPWAHQALHGGQATLKIDLVTVAESLRNLGFATAGYFSSRWLRPKFGYGQGFESVTRLGAGNRAAAHLESLDGTPSFIWIHLPSPRTPYTVHDHLRQRLRHAPQDLPQEVTPADLEPYFDPAVELPQDRREVFWSAYCLNVASADQQLGRFLRALRRSGQWHRTLLVATSNHGEEFGEHGQILHGGNLGRALVEVPLVIKLPRGFQRPLRVEDEDRPATARLAATLVEAGGGRPVPAAAPSLFYPDHSGALSELYLGNGTNEFSLVLDSYQLRWTSRFAAAEPEYYRARLVQVGGLPRTALREPPDKIFMRLEEAFLLVPPLSGIDAAPALLLERWTIDGVEAVEDAVRTAELAERLRARWMSHLESETPPAQALVDGGTVGD